MTHKLELTIEEKRQTMSACWNERAKLEKLLKEREEKGKTCRCSTHERIDVLDNVIGKLRKLV